MANNNSSDDVIIGVVALAGVAVAGYVGYKVIKAIAEYEQTVLAEQRQAALAANYIPSAPQQTTSSASDDVEDDYYPDYWAEDEEDE